jgi:tetratricopeptide (TPR) repeat protein
MMPNSDFIRKFQFVIFFILMIYPIGNFLQAETAGATDKEVKTGLTTVFTESNPNIIFVEGEEAVATNFDKEPKLNFGCSGQKTLQLNKSRDTEAGLTYYADYVFYTDEPGTYELWYGGTPPGPKETLLPSYGSPFEYVIDNAASGVSVYRENSVVMENYSPVYYWTVIGTEKLGAGEHSVRFNVKEKRRFDGKYFFYLDCFFFVRKDGGRRNPGKLLPEVFPKTLEEKRQNLAFRSIDDCMISIRDNPGTIAPLIEISRIYSLLGDNLSAIKFLKRAWNIDAEDQDVLLLLAKNDIWRGEITEGLDYYSELLSIDPSRLLLWLEAGKVAGWMGIYEESIDFFTQGLAKFPGNLDLLANLGLTYLWAGMKSEAEDTFKKARDLVKNDVKAQKQLGRTFMTAGYPDLAAELYADAIASAPADVESYLLLAGAYFVMNKNDDVTNVKSLIAKTFAPSERLTQYTNLFFQKLGLRDQAIANYEATLKTHQDDLALREMLSQAYYWRGRTRDAIFESLNLLAFYLFRDLSNSDKASFGYLEVIDRLEADSAFLESLKKNFEKTQRDLRLKTDEYNKALRTLADYRAKKKAAEDAGKKWSEPEMNPSETLAASEAELRRIVGEIDLLAQQYDRVAASVAKLTDQVKPFSDQNAEEEKSFQKRIEQIKWIYDRQSYEAELGDVAGRGFALARNVLARLSLANDSGSKALKQLELAKGVSNAPELEFSLVEAYIKEGELEKAAAVFDGAQDKLRAYAPYLADFISFVKSLGKTPSPGSVNVLADELPDRAKETESILSKIVRDSDGLLKTAQKAGASVLALYKQKMIRAFFAFEEETYLMRNELGDYFIKSDFTRAIIQYKRVLAIDPWDISALSRLGSAYDKAGEWQKAQEYYKRVFWADPTYENPAERYNKIAREHADSLNTSTSYLVDSGSTEWDAKALYEIELNELLGFSAEYKGWAKRVYLSTPLDPENTGEYTVQNLMLGLPISFANIGLKVTPQAGITATLNDVFYNTVFTRPATPVDFLTYGSYYPAIKVYFATDPERIMSANGNVSFDVYKETLGVTHVEPRIYEIGGDCNLNLSLKPLKTPVLKNLSARLYGEGHYLLDSTLSEGFNLIWAALAELSFAIISIEDPSINLSIFANAFYQDTTSPIDEASLAKYYMPQNVLITGGGLTFSSYFNSSENSVIGLGFAAGVFYAGQYENWIFNGEAPGYRNRLKIQADLNIEYTRDNATFYVKPEFVVTPNLVTSNFWDYWDFYVTAGINVNLPSLLAP